MWVSFSVSTCRDGASARAQQRLTVGETVRPKSSDPILTLGQGTSAVTSARFCDMDLLLTRISSCSPNALRFLGFWGWGGSSVCGFLVSVAQGSRLPPRPGSGWPRASFPGPGLPSPLPATWPVSAPRSHAWLSRLRAPAVQTRLSVVGSAPTWHRLP